VAVEASAVVDAAVGAFKDPSSWLHEEPVSGFRTGHGVDTDAGALGGVGDRRTGVALVQPDVCDGWGDPFDLAQ
jgi:hypothetical protein